MDAIVKLWRADSARIVSIVLALVAVGVIPGTLGKTLGAVLPLLGGQAVRQTVWAPTSVSGAVEGASMAVAAGLAADSVGAVGEVTSAAEQVVGEAVSTALSRTKA